MIFVISSHGESGILIDSKCRKHHLELLFGSFEPQAASLFENYPDETEEESNYLSAIPKIFLLGMCRGQPKSKPVLLGHRVKQASGVTKSLELKNNSHSTNNNSDDKEIFGLKVVSKEMAKTVASQASNFYKLYATPDGYGAAEGGKDGGLFLRNVCRIFKDTKFVYEHVWNDIVLKIGRYTKREATILSDVLPITQILEGQGTLENNVKFKPNPINVTVERCLRIMRAVVRDCIRVIVMFTVLCHIVYNNRNSESAESNESLRDDNN